MYISNELVEEHLRKVSNIIENATNVMSKDILASGVRCKRRKTNGCQTLAWRG